ncbi:capsid protein [Escherichia coli]|nr:capsid protein [Escherichia coli]EFA4608764.1 capsid protein [Escherichia coli]OUP44170.1 capsid protein [Escherichia coli]
MSNVGSRSHVVYKNVLRLAGELSIVRVLNDFQPEWILMESI